MNQLTLYTHPHSRGRNVRWMLEECGADYETVGVPFGAAMKSPDYRAINPLGKVPALRAGATVITETAAIISYLADRFPERALIPTPGSEARGEYYRWLFFAVHLEYAAIDVWRGIKNNEEQKLAIGYGDFDEAVQLLRNHLHNRHYFLEERFTALDLYYSGLLAWLMRTQLLPNGAPFSDYMQRHLQRPACQKAAALDEELLKQLNAAG